MGSESCKACFKTIEIEPVLIRHSREEGWVESTVRRCANPECHTVRSGTMEDRLTHVRNVYDYKYFGDYELSPEQLDAVWEAYAFAMRVPALVAALRAARDFAESEVENRSHAGGSMSDYINEAQEIVDLCDATLSSQGGDHG